jgi:hypothetical protein
MKLYRYKKDGCLYTLYENILRFPYYTLIAVPYFPNQGILAKANWMKKRISMNDFVVVAER